jgi:DNA polymerase IV
MPARPPPLFLALEAPEFPAQALAAWDDRLRGRPFAVVEQDPGSHKTYVIAVSPAAKHAGLAAGMPLAAARRRLPGLEAAPRNPAWEAALGDELRALCRGYTPEAEVRGGRALLDMTGTPAARALRPLGLARKLLRDARFASGLAEVYAGAAATRLMAKVMARLCAERGDAGGEGAEACPPGSESLLLDPLPPVCLPGLSPQCRARLRRYSLGTVGQVRALGREALAARFGAEGDKLYTLSCGLDLEAARAERCDLSAETVLPADRNDDDALARAVRLTADKLVFQLRARGLQADRIALAIRYADGKAARKTASVRPRTCDFAVLAGLADGLFRALYQRRVALRAVSLTAPAPRPDTGQTELFAGEGDLRQRALGDALAKIRARAGFGAILSGSNLGEG